jgi:hypothetical protein
MKLVIVDDHGTIHDVLEDVEEFDFTRVYARSELAHEVQRVIYQIEEEELGR